MILEAYGRDQGEEDDVRHHEASDVVVHRGIRFAQPPVGALRWKAPVPLAGRPTVENTFGPSPMQHMDGSGDVGPGICDEDCLTLNVWAPQSATPEHPLPVMVWIFGGAYTYGSGSNPAFDGAQLAARGVVAVTLNYRLGPLGWIDEPALGPTNLGMRDVMCALGWVRENIRSLGGDEGNVTVFGESAGAGIITSMMASPAAAGLFDAAISQSSPATTLASREMGAHVAKRLREILGVSVEELRDLAPARIVEAGEQLYAEIPVAQPGHLAWTVTCGDDLLPEDPVRVLAQGRGLPVPLVIGTNRSEAGSFWISRSPVLPINRTGLAALFAEARDLDPDANLPDLPHHRKQAWEEATDVCFRMPAVWIAEGHSAVAPTYLYRFDHATPLLRLIGVGSGHTTEIPYVFNSFRAMRADVTLMLGGEHVARDIARRMQERWTAFAREGYPGARELCAWPPYDSATRPTLVIDREDRVVEDLDAEGLKVWGNRVEDLLSKPRRVP